jgi:stearoyl-CoA desaturase (Delta-9 desaturase)
MWGITAGYHRYFSHRSYKTSRVMQFIIALHRTDVRAARGDLVGRVHRHHHLYSDTEHDVHSPRHQGFLYSHVGWIFNHNNWKPDYGTVKDLTKYPELVWLNKTNYIPAILLGVALFLWGGWTMLVVGFFWSTVALYHGTFFINSLAHVHGSQRYLTGDDSRNNFWLALITLGEGWHNNHHHYQSSTRQGFRWWEIDLSYYALKVMSWFRLVWDLRSPPEIVVRARARSGGRCSRRSPASWPRRSASSRSRSRCATRGRVARSRISRPGARQARGQVGEAAGGADVAAPADHSRAAGEGRGDVPGDPSLDMIVNRAHEMLAQAVAPTSATRRSPTPDPSRAPARHLGPSRRRTRRHPPLPRFLARSAGGGHSFSRCRGRGPGGASGDAGDPLGKGGPPS